jgi:hypothetical protein
MPGWKRKSPLELTLVILCQSPEVDNRLFFDFLYQEEDTQGCLSLNVNDWNAQC